MKAILRIIAALVVVVFIMGVIHRKMCVSVWTIWPGHLIKRYMLPYT